MKQRTTFHFNMRIPSPKKRNDIIALFKAPVFAKGLFLQIRLRKTTGKKALLIIVPKKCGIAVRRNRIRRIIRGWFRIRWQKFPDNISFMVKVSTDIKNISKNKLSTTLRTELEKLTEQFRLPKSK